MDELFPSVIVIVALLAAIVFDWPRAVAGACLGVAIRWLPWRLPACLSGSIPRWVASWLLGGTGVAAITLVGEFVYPLFWRGHHTSSASLVIGAIVSSVCALGVFRVAGSMLE